MKNIVEKLLKLTEEDEKLLQQKSKVDWIKLGDANNAYFHVIVRGRNKLEDRNGNKITQPEEMGQVVLKFYKELVSTNTANRRHVDIEVLRKGKTTV